MIRELLQRSVVSNHAVAQVCSSACVLVGAAVLVLGFRRFEAMDFNEGQLYLATIGTLSLAGVFVGLALLFHPRVLFPK